MVDSPPNENKILLTNKTVTLTMACLTRVTEPKEVISFKRVESKKKASHLGRSTDFFERKK